MTLTLPGADIRGFYAELNIDLPRWAKRNAPARCFANPEAHAHADRTPSMSINLQDGSWYCHGCGAKGGPFRAATSVGHTDRGARELMIAHRLAKPDSPEHPSPPRHRTATADPQTHPPRIKRPRLQIDKAQLRRWHTRLLSDPGLLTRLRADRGWKLTTIRDLGLGFDGRRITIPVYDQHHDLVSLLRYQPGAPTKIRAAAGSRRVLYPHPAHETAASILLVEGEPDAITARSLGLPAIAVPGTESWQPAWATQFTERDVTIIMDCDHQGRACAHRVADDLRATARRIKIIDLAPTRTDGYDLTDWLTDSWAERAVRELA
jgi:DNA primase